MKIYELINNKEFLFNAKFKVYKYIPLCDKNGGCIEGDTVLMYDSEVNNGLFPDLCQQDISAINQAEDGTVEIEYIQSGWAY